MKHVAVRSSACLRQERTEYDVPSYSVQNSGKARLLGCCDVSGFNSNMRFIGAEVACRTF